MIAGIFNESRLSLEQLHEEETLELARGTDIRARSGRVVSNAMNTNADLFAQEIDRGIGSGLFGSPSRADGLITRVRSEMGCGSNKAFDFVYEYSADHNNALLRNHYVLWNANGGSAVAQDINRYQARFFYNSSNANLNQFKEIRRRGDHPGYANGTLIDLLYYNLGGTGSHPGRIRDLGEYYSHGSRGFKPGYRYSPISYDLAGNVLSIPSQRQKFTYAQDVQRPSSVQVMYATTTNYYLQDNSSIGYKDEQGDTYVRHGSWEYKNSQPYRYHHAEGFYDIPTSKWNYYLKDYLGTPRVTFTDVNNDGQITQADVLEQKTTYPFGMFAFGMRAAGYDADRRDFTGHQVVGSNTDRYHASMDMQARYYSPGMASFVGVDPLASSMPSYSPYAYGFNNPVGYTDPTGMAPVGPGDPPKAFLWAGKHVANFVNNTLPAGAQVAVGAFNYARETRVGSFVEGMANNTAAAVVDVGTTTTFPVINQLGVIANEGVHEGGAYSEDSNILPTTYTLTEDWSLAPQEEMATMSASDSEKRGKQLMQNTVKVLTTAAPSPGTAAGKAAATGAKAVINKAAEKLLEVEDNTSSGNPSGA